MYYVLVPDQIPPRSFSYTSQSIHIVWQVKAGGISLTTFFKITAIQISNVEMLILSYIQWFVLLDPVFNKQIAVEDHTLKGEVILG